MSEEPSKTPSEADKELEREIREGRKFTLTEAIGRLAGPGMMKGVSPATLKQQAAVAIHEYLQRHLHDGAGILPGVLFREVKESDLLLEHLEEPLMALRKYVEQVLASDYRLKELVRLADIEWGQVFGERPYFEQEGCPPDPNDPYTWHSVRTSLTALLATFTEPEASPKTE